MGGIETARLRMWRDEDLDAYARMHADPEVMRHLSGPMTREQSEEQVARFVRHWEERGFGLWAAEHKADGAFIGFVGLLDSEDWPARSTRPRWDGGSIAPTGTGARSRRAPWRASATVSNGSSALISITLPQNAASRRVIEKTGQTFRGETRWSGQDVVWYAIDRRDWQNANP